MRHRQKYASPRKPPCFSGSYEEGPNVRKFCPECRQITTKRHLCNPLCRRCETYYFPGSSPCDTFCGSYPCCGCCDETRTTTVAANMALPSLDSNKQQRDQIQFPDLLTIIHQLIDFMFSENKLQLDLRQGIYRSVITAVGGSEAFANIIYNTIDPDIRALKNQLITAEI